MKKLISFIIVTIMIASAVVFPTEVHGDSNSYAGLVRYWAPTLYHALNPACNDAKGDFVTNFNYDGDWNGNNNWDNLENYPMKSYVYYAIQETQTHYFIGYYFFHPQDDAEELDADKHENDLEGIILVVRKTGGYGTFELMETQAHNHWYQYTTNNSNITSGFDDVDGHVLFDGSHPKVYIQPNGDLWGHGHGVKAYDGSGSPTGYGNVYKYTGTAQIPNMDQNWGDYEYQIGYDLISIDELWNRRYDYKKFEEQGSEERATFQKFGVFDGNNYCVDAATAPWGWEDPDDGPVGKGMNFSDPAHFVDTHLNGLGEFSHTYVYNPYYTYKLKISEISSEADRDGFLGGTSDIYPVILIGNNAEKYGLEQLWKKDNAVTGAFYNVNWGGYQADDDAEYSTNYNSLYFARDISDTIDLRIMDSDSLIFDDLNEDDYMGSIIINPSNTGTATWSRFITNNAQAKVTLSLEINNKPPVITFTAGTHYGESEVEYITEGDANSVNVPDFNIVVEDLDAIFESDNITRVEIRRVRTGGGEDIIKTYNTANKRIQISEDIYGCMNPSSSPYYDATQTFKVVAYQGSYMYQSKSITVKLLEYFGPNIILSPCKLDPNNPNDEYSSPTVKYTSPVYANEITSVEKDPKFYIKVNNNFGQPEGSSKILWVKLMELNAYGPGSHKIVKVISFTNEQLKSVVELELLASECMGNGTDKTFAVEVMNGSGKVYTSEAVRVLWNIETSKPWIRFGIKDVPEDVATYANQKLTCDIIEYQNIKNADPKFNIAIEGNSIIDKIELVNQGNNIIWTKDISILNTTEVAYDIRVFTTTQIFDKYRVKVTTRDGQIYYSQEIRIDWMEYKLSENSVRMYVKGYPISMNNVTIQSEFEPWNTDYNTSPKLHIDYWAWFKTDGTLSVPRYVNIRKQDGTILDTVFVNGQSGGFDYPIGSLMNGQHNQSLFAELVCEGDFQTRNSENINLNWLVNQEPIISFMPYGQAPINNKVTITSDKLPSQVPDEDFADFHVEIGELDNFNTDIIQRVELVDGMGNILEDVNVSNENSSSIVLDFDAASYMDINTDYIEGRFVKTFILKVINRDCKVYTKEVAVNWIYNEKSIVNFYINQNPTVVQQYYLGAPDEQLEGRPTFHISVNDPDNNGNEIVTKVEIKRKRDNKVVKSYNVAEQNSRSFDADVDIFQLLNYSVYECYYVTVTYSGQQNTNSREIHVCWNQPSEIELTSDLQNDNGEITINSQYSPQEAEQLGVSPEFYVVVNGIDSFYENIIQKIEIVNTAGEVVDRRDYNDFIYSTEEFFSIAKCLGNSTSGEFYARVTLYDGNTYIAPESLKVNWIVEHSPVIDFTIYGQGEGATVYIPEESLPGKEPKLSVRVTDPDNTDSDIISKVEILTTNGVVIKTFNVLTQNSRYISINEEITQYIEQDYNYFSIKVTNKGGKVYTTGGIYVYYGNSSEDEYK